MSPLGHVDDITAPVLFQNIQRTWDARQAVNLVKIPSSFLEAVSGTLDSGYFARQAEVQYLNNPAEAVDVVVFGHTHVPVYNLMENGKCYVNEGTWIDHNTNYPDAERTFAVITTGDTTTARLYAYEEDGGVTDITAHVAGDDALATTDNAASLIFETKVLENYGDETTQARYMEVSGLADEAVQEALNENIKAFCLHAVDTADADTTYDIEPIAEVVSDVLLSVSVYEIAFTAGAAYPVSSIRSQLFSLATGEPYTVNLWDFIQNKDALVQLIADGKFGFMASGIEEELPEELITAAYETLAQSISAGELGEQFFFADGKLYLWCESDTHATGDYWLFDISIADLASAF